jgi:hypothetical protein
MNKIIDTNGFKNLRPQKKKLIIFLWSQFLFSFFFLLPSIQL